MIETSSDILSVTFIKLLYGLEQGGQGVELEHFQSPSMFVVLFPPYMSLMSLSSGDCGALKKEKILIELRFPGRNPKKVKGKVENWDKVLFLRFLDTLNDIIGLISGIKSPMKRRKCQGRNLRTVSLGKCAKPDRLKGAGNRQGNDQSLYKTLNWNLVLGTH